MNRQSPHQIFNFDRRITSPLYHFTEGHDARFHHNSSVYNMTQSMGLPYKSSNALLTNSPCQSANYNSLRTDKNNNKILIKGNTLSRRSSMNEHNSQTTVRQLADSKHEHCLNWLEAGDSYEREAKELDANIELLLWKKRHLEVLQKQKIQGKKVGRKGSTNASDSPPPLSDFFKPELSSVSADDGFESAVDTINHHANLNHISYLESELRKRDFKIQRYQEMVDKKEHKNFRDFGFLTPQQTSFDPSSFSNYHNHHNTYHRNNNNTLDTSFQSLRISPKTFTTSPPINNPTSTPLKKNPPTLNNTPPKLNHNTTLDSKVPVRPTSFQTALHSPLHSPLSSHRSLPFSSFLTPNNHHSLFHTEGRSINGGSANGGMQVLKLKSELLLKEQHLRKIRVALKELSTRHNELLEQHMNLLNSTDHSPRSIFTSPITHHSQHPLFNNGGMQSGVNELQEVVEQLQDLVESKRFCSSSQLPSACAPERPSMDRNLKRLQHKISLLRLKFRPNQDTPPDPY